MKRSQAKQGIAILMLAAATAACRPQPAEQRAQMLLDSDASGRNVAIVKPKELARPAESVPDLRELSTIMQYDIDVAQRAPSKEIVYVERGQPMRPSERR